MFLKHMQWFTNNKGKSTVGQVCPFSFLLVPGSALVQTVQNELHFVAVQLLIYVAPRQTRAVGH